MLQLKFCYRTQILAAATNLFSPCGILFISDVNLIYFFRESTRIHNEDKNWLTLSRFLEFIIYYTLRVILPHVIEIDVTSRARPRDWRGKMSFGDRIVITKLIRILHHHGHSLSGQTPGQSYARSSIHTFAINRQTIYSWQRTCSLVQCACSCVH